MPDFFQHPDALVESRTIGRGTRIWAFAHVLPDAVLGMDCNVCDHVFIENDVIVGDRVTVKCGVQLWDGVRLEDDVFVGPNVTFTNDPMPRSRQRPLHFPETIVRRGASIGANATLLPGITIGAGAMIGAGSVVTRSVPPYAVVVGNPARIVRYLDDAAPARPPAQASVAPAPMALRVDEVQVISAPIIKDMRGNLSARETGKGLPFTPERCFLVFDVPSKEVRGAHAHAVCRQLLVCVRGAVAVVCDDGSHRQEVLLDNVALGLYVPPMIWCIQYKFTSDAMLLVLASHGYDPADYIRDYDEFLRERKAFDARRAR